MEQQQQIGLENRARLQEQQERGYSNHKDAAALAVSSASGWRASAERLWTNPHVSIHIYTHVMHVYVYM